MIDPASASGVDRADDGQPRFVVGASAAQRSPPPIAPLAADFYSVPGGGRYGKMVGQWKQVYVWECFPGSCLVWHPVMNGA